MEGIIANFRRSKHRARTNQMVVEAAGVDSKDKAKALIGKRVTWTSPAKNEIHGVVKKEHGNRGALRVLFERGMPGQAIGQKVQIS